MGQSKYDVEKHLDLQELRDYPIAFYPVAQDT